MVYIYAPHFADFRRMVHRLQVNPGQAIFLKDLERIRGVKDVEVYISQHFPARPPLLEEIQSRSSKLHMI